MRLLFTFVGGRGHFEPLAGVARAAAAAGHEVAFGCVPPMADAVRSAGFPAFAMGDLPVAPQRRLPLRPVDRAREERDLRERFVRLAGRYRAPLVLELCREWLPDVLVCDETDFGAMVAAERLALPFATLLVAAAGSFVRREVVGAALGELRAEHGLPPDPELAMLSRHLVLSPFPPSYRDPAHPLPATAHSFRPPPLEAAAGASPVPPPERPGVPRVYLTLGTVFNTESGDLLARLVEGLRALPIELVVTVGHAIDPSELGPQPAHVRVERYIPQAQLLAHCDLVVSHGGSGSVVGALAHGLPSVLVPLGADQPWNADRCAALGVARVLDAATVTAASVREAAEAVLGDPAYRRSAERLRDEIAALPEVASAVSLLERLAREKQPIHSTHGWSEEREG